MDQRHYLTQAKHDELKDELDFLTTTRRMEIARQLEHTRSFGDLSENAEYHQTRQLQGEIEARIAYLAALLQDVEIIAPHKSDVVEVGSTVTVQKRGEKEERVYQITGSEEADTAAGRISLNSPLGAAMLGKKKGETFEFTSPAGKRMEYTILKIA